jgi:hypothetical protein
MADIELTDELRRALATSGSAPIPLVDPTTNQRYVLLAQEEYDALQPLNKSAQQQLSLVPAGILRSQRAFWRELPKLLLDKSKHGMWVCYHGDEQVGIAESDVPLLRECARRGLREDEYDLNLIEPRQAPPWVPEEIEPGGNESDDLL